MNNDQIYRRWFEEVWNQGSEQTIDELLPQNVAAHGLADPGETHRGPEAFKEFWRQLRGAFPDMHFVIDGLVSEGNIVAGRWTVKMTHKGDHLGVPPTQKPVTITGMTFLRIENGKIYEGWNNWDQLTLTRQLGLPLDLRPG